MEESTESYVVYCNPQNKMSISNVKVLCNICRGKRCAHCHETGLMAVPMKKKI